MKYFNEPLEIEVRHITEDVKDLLKENRHNDEALNYLHYLRDEINKLIKETKKSKVS